MSEQPKFQRQNKVQLPPIQGNGNEKVLISGSNKKRQVLELQEKKEKQEKELQRKGKRLQVETQRNITDGKVEFPSIKQNDIVADDFYQIKEDINQIFNQAPLKVSSHIENIKYGNFSNVNKQSLQAILDQHQDNKDFQSYNKQDELIQAIQDCKDLFRKLFIFFQGLISGIWLMHVIIVYTIDYGPQFNSICLRMNQFLSILSFVSLLGAVFNLMDNKIETFHQDFKSLISTTMYGLSYILNGYNRIFVSRESARLPDNNKFFYFNKSINGFYQFQVINIIICIFTFSSWLTIIIFTQFQTQKDKENNEELYHESQDDNNALIN